MKVKKDIEKAFIVLMAVFMLLVGFSTRVYAVEKNQADVETQEKEYEKWKIKKVKGVYFYKEKSVRLLVDDAGEKAVTNNFFYNKKGKVDIKVIRNKKGKIKKIKYISKKRAEEIIKNYNTAYHIGK